MKSDKKSLKQKMMQKVDSLYSSYNNVFLIEVQNLTKEVQSALIENVQGELYFGKFSVASIFFKEKHQPFYNALQEQKCKGND